MDSNTPTDVNTNSGLYQVPSPGSVVVPIVIGFTLYKCLKLILNYYAQKAAANSAAPASNAD